jgi:hypothetical protein
MADDTAGQSAPTASSTDSVQGSGSLSDAFVAAASGEKSHQGSKRRVQAPEGSAQLSIRRSARVASSRSKSAQGGTLHTSLPDVVEAPSVAKRKTGYVHQVLQSVTEESGLSSRPVGPTGYAVDSRGTAAPQLGSVAGTPALKGRKRSATSAAPSAGHRGPTSRRLASAGDFSPTHFVEPVSETGMQLQRPSPQDSPAPSRQQHPLSPMIVNPAGTHFQSTTTPLSSPISQNPLLLKQSQTPSPSQPRPSYFRTRDSNAAWAAAEGLLPVHEGFAAPGYVPAVGGITYCIPSPPRQSAQRSMTGRQLFANLASADERAQGAPLMQQHMASQSVRPAYSMQQHIASQSVRPAYSYLLRAYIHLCILQGAPLMQPLSAARSVRALQHLYFNAYIYFGIYRPLRSCNSGPHCRALSRGHGSLAQ